MSKCVNCFESVEHRDGRWMHPHSGDIVCWTGDGSVATSDTWPEGTLRGEYDRDYDRIVCALCDWYEVGGPTGCSWAYHDHVQAEHPRAVKP